MMDATTISVLVRPPRFRCTRRNYAMGGTVEDVARDDSLDRAFSAAPPELRGEPLPVAQRVLELHDPPAGGLEVLAGVGQLAPGVLDVALDELLGADGLGRRRLPALGGGGRRSLRAVVALWPLVLIVVWLIVIWLVCVGARRVSQCESRGARAGGGHHVNARQRRAGSRRARFGRGSSIRRAPNHRSRPVVCMGRTFAHLDRTLPDVHEHTSRFRGGRRRS